MESKLSSDRLDGHHDLDVISWKDISTRRICAVYSHIHQTVLLCINELYILISPIRAGWLISWWVPETQQSSAAAFSPHSSACNSNAVKMSRWPKSRWHYSPPKRKITCWIREQSCSRNRARCTALHFLCLCAFCRLNTLDIWRRRSEAQERGVGCVWVSRNNVGQSQAPQREHTYIYRQRLRLGPRSGQCTVYWHRS